MWDPFVCAGLWAPMFVWHVLDKRSEVDSFAPTSHRKANDSGRVLYKPHVERDVL